MEKNHAQKNTCHCGCRCTDCHRVSFSTQPTITRTPLQTVDLPPGYQTVSVIAEIAPGPCIGRHTHPGIESTYAIEGEVVVKIDGKPDQVVKAGNSIVFAAGLAHDVCNMSGKPFKALAVYVVEKGKPLASPAP
jgi:quercetin dioxygenase-like cupin family protein